eukprot:UN10222
MNNNNSMMLLTKPTITTSIIGNIDLRVECQYPITTQQEQQHIQYQRGICPKPIQRTSPYWLQIYNNQTNDNNQTNNNDQNNCLLSLDIICYDLNNIIYYPNTTIWCNHLL